ncbi:hypothetical protein [Bacillus sp. UMB0728]|uniref:hypothetical protein n=1 Tax=Bacillus sp. UMB0728 TaxID=2066052 RepID=UPI00115A53A3|nr:hypothetical protein [Bacillus sp. UMB0728]
MADNLSGMDLNDLKFYRSQYEEFINETENELSRERSEYYIDKLNRELDDLKERLNEINDWISHREYEEEKEHLKILGWDNE